MSEPGNSEATFRSSNQVATCPPVYHTLWRLHTVLLFDEVMPEAVNTNSYSLIDLIRAEIEPESTVPVAVLSISGIALTPSDASQTERLLLEQFHNLNSIDFILSVKRSRHSQ